MVHHTPFFPRSLRCLAFTMAWLALLAGLTLYFSLPVAIVLYCLAGAGVFAMLALRKAAALRLARLHAAHAEEQWRRCEGRLEEYRSLLEQGGVKEILPLAMLVNAAKDAAAHLFKERQQRLSFHLPCEPLCLHADAARARQLLCLLLQHVAMDNAPRGVIALNAQRDGDSLLIAIGSDAASGVQPEAGMALAHARILAELEGGHMEIHTESSHAARLMLRLPLAHIPVAQPHPAAHSGERHLYA